MRCFVATCLALTGVDGAGMNKHTYVGYRAATRYAKILNSPNASKYNDAIAKNIPAVLGGSDFPDFGYACGKVSAILRVDLVCNRLLGGPPFL